MIKVSQFHISKQYYFQLLKQVIKEIEISLKFKQ